MTPPLAFALSASQALRILAIGGCHTAIHVLNLGGAAATCPAQLSFLKTPDRGPIGLEAPRAGQKGQVNRWSPAWAGVQRLQPGASARLPDHDLIKGAMTSAPAH